MILKIENQKSRHSEEDTDLWWSYYSERQLQVATPHGEKQHGFIDLFFIMVNNSPEGKPASFRITPIKTVNWDVHMNQGIKI